MSSDSVKALYKTLLRHARTFPQYNYRNFALRKIKEDFSNVKLLKTSEELNKFMDLEREKLEQLKRMVKIQSLYVNESSKLILENTEKPE